ncbi:PQQ-like beta-propeller repeat protein [candidate division KSB1 bacterium]|nr:PQQ-like beta-propeller repeat protein [candidate division KSB1 bacterium]
MKWLFLALGVGVFPLAVNSVGDDDWPQFRGKNRDGVAHAVAEIKPWPKEGPRLAWQVDIGEGFSGISVAGDRIFTMFADGKNEFLASFELASGKEVWRVKVDEMLKNRHGNGPRSTPAVDEQNVYGLSSRGHLMAVEKKTGKLQWEAFCKQDFRSEGPGHGFSSSPLVEGNMLLLQTEAGNGKAVAAFDKRSGRVLWTAGYGGDGYCSPTSFIYNGERQFIFVASGKAVALSPAGKILWEKRAGPGLIAMPLFIAPDKVFIPGSGETNGMLMKIAKMQNNFAVEEVWSNNQLRDSFNSPIFYNDHLYGFSGAFLVCIDLATGARKWAQRGFGEGSVVLAGGHLITMGGKGNIALAQATPEKYLEVGSIQALRGKCWTAPTIARNKLLLRNHVEMVCYDLAAQ